jgi:hypothetical protein
MWRCYKQQINPNSMVFLIWHWDVDAQGLFKLTMKSNAIQVMAIVVALTAIKIQLQFF